MSLRKHNFSDNSSSSSWGEGLLSYAKFPLLFLCLLSLAVSASATHTASVAIDPSRTNCDSLGNTFTINVKNAGPVTDDEILQVESNSDDITAEMYCHKDVLNYDNYDYITRPKYGQTYYCIAFNALDDFNYCGDGILDNGEECDLSQDNGTICEPPYDGSCQWCNSECEWEEESSFCGDHVLDSEEECDDGNNEDGDGCSSECTVEEECPEEIVTSKIVGEPKEACDYLGEGQEAEECWFVTAETLFTLETNYQTGGSWCNVVDITMDGKIDDEDLNMLLDNWGRTDCFPENDYCERTDVTRNNEVDDSDLAVVLGNFGTTCQQGAETYYRQRWKEGYEDVWGTWGPWSLYTGPFTKKEDSIHELEYYSVDNYCKVEEEHHLEIDIVDSQAPETVKTVGEPKEEWDGESSIFYPEISGLCWKGQNPLECWKVTMKTPIQMECIDQEPHPSGNERLCFYVELDGDNATADYCERLKGNASDDGYCCIGKSSVELFFAEESEHNLKYYCVDELQNKSAIDDEKFKVEGRTFEIQINKKWNLISVPFVLTDSNIARVLEDIIENVESVWSYDAFTKQWKTYRPNSPGTNTLHSLEPGEGYWLAAYSNDTLVLQGSLFGPVSMPPSKSLKRGLNLIGYYGTDGLESYNGPQGNGKTAGCALYSLGTSVWDKGWTSLWTYWEPDNPIQWKFLGKNDRMDPGAGYWVIASEDSVYSYSTTC